MEFNPHKITDKYGREGVYQTPPHPVPLWPTPRFFAKTIVGPLFWLWLNAVRNKLTDNVWINSSAWFADIFEAAGCTIRVEGLENIGAAQGPCVFIGNHISTLETFVLPGIIRPIMPVTFVVKKSLTTMPVFGPIMRSRDPIVVGRVNPREDLSTVLEEGSKRLANGISVVVFPQHTRSLVFDPHKFNTIGIKLALKANAPVIPLALKTDAWAQGKKIKELGGLNPNLTAFFRFGKPMRIAGRGKDEHAAIRDFIQNSLSEWRQQEAQQ